MFNQNGTWETGASFSISPQFKGIVYARAVDKAGNISQIVSTDGVVSDNTTPTAPIIAASTSDGAYNGDWTSKNINITALGSKAFSGINHYEYKVGSYGDWKQMTSSSGATDSVSGKIINDTFTISDNVAANVFVRAVSNSGLTSEASSILLKKDNEIPQTSVNITGVVNKWTTSSVKFTLGNGNENIIAPIYYYIKIGSTDWIRLDGNAYTFDKEINTTVQLKSVTSAGVENIYPTAYEVKIDRTKPEITGADDNGSYYFGKTINYSDGQGEIASATYTKDNGNSVNFASGTFLSNNGKYIISVTDKAGNQSSIAYTVKTLPTVGDIVYTDASKNSIEAIRQEFNNNLNLPEAYMDSMDSAIKALEDRYSDLDNQVKKEMSAAATIPTADDGLIAQKASIQKTLDDISKLTKEQQEDLKPQVDALNSLLGKIDTLQLETASEKVIELSIPTGDDGLIGQKASVEKTLNDISKLTKEQQAALKPEVAALNTLLNRIAALEGQIDSEKKAVAAIPTAEDGLIAQKSAIQKTLDDISKLTKEQQSVLKSEVDTLNKLLDKANELSKQVEDVKNAITALPDAKDVKKTDADNIIKTKNSFDSLNSEQKNLVGQELTDKLNAVVDQLAKLMLYDSPNDVTVTGVDGTTFSPDTYLKVTPLTDSANSDATVKAQDAIDNAGKSDSKLQDKDLLVLYDVSMLKGETKIEPDGKVKVKIKIPDKYKGRKQLDIVHIADDGKVTLMNATIEGDYLVFITDHFSKYGIIAKDNCVLGICKAFGVYDRQNGICYDWVFVLGAAILVVGMGSFIFYKKKKKKSEAQAE